MPEKPTGHFAHSVLHTHLPFVLGHCRWPHGFMTAPQVLSLILWQASLLRMSNARMLKGYLGGMEARFVGGVCLVLVAIGASACTGVISSPPVPKIYVADASNNRIVRMDDMTGAGWITLGGPLAGSGMNQFSFPSGIYVSSAGQIFVTDAFNHRIVRMDTMTGTGWIVLDAEDHYVLEALQGGISGYVLKTQAAPDLAQALGEVARGSISLSPGVFRT